MKEIRGYNKSEMLYPDRGMLKWRGMLLSDHSERMKHEKAVNKQKDIHATKKPPPDHHSDGG